ncbi:IS66 family insertion sequence element accessory protein TnpB, partial [Mesorhizobium sp. M1328]|uniref:IS66 family insertion sequence element accessory protein TnpB n=1 Tax=Mesorhizobium sp. M1328 TaxID=2957082 RepID=UPI00333540A8
RGRALRTLTTPRPASAQASAQDTVCQIKFKLLHITMAISIALQAQILRYHHVEKWRVNTIARQLGVHHHTVQCVLARSGLLPHGPRGRPSQIDAYLPFILETLNAFPSLTAARLYGMVKERGYRGDGGHFRHMIARYRPRQKAEAYLRLRTLPGEQAQADWGHFGHIQIGRARRPLMAFVIVLSQSRLEDGEFRWPKVQDGVMRLTAAQLSALLEGLDWRRVHEARQTRVPVQAG